MPSEMLLMALGGCTSMDIVSLLKKFNTTLTKLRVELDGQRRSEHPKSFTTIIVTYRMDGEISPEQAWKAVSSSYRKYSVVANSLRPELDYRIILNGHEVTGEK